MSPVTNADAAKIINLLVKVAQATELCRTSSSAQDTQYPAKEKAPRRGLVGDVPHLRTSFCKGALDNGCAGTNVVDARTHQKNLQRSPPSATRHGSVNTSQTSAWRTSAKSVEDWHVPLVPSVPKPAERQAQNSPGKSDSDECEVREEEYVHVEDMSHRNRPRTGRTQRR